MKHTYEHAGVSISAGSEAVSQIKEIVRGTFQPNVLTDIGLFGGCFQFPAEAFKQPVLVASTDGVGTKLMVANILNRHDTVGQCLVNHCVNDILTTGAAPLFFLDYIGTGKLEPATVKEIISGMAKACRENGCSLIGGEMAEMPGIYQVKDYDLVGTIVGVVDRQNMMTGKVRKGDLLLGLQSTGLHTNGFSLARKVLLEKYKVNEFVDSLGATVGDTLLRIHRSYLKPVRPLLQNAGLHAISHITGGGIVGNTSRVLPDSLQLKIDWNAWNWLPIFRLIQEAGEIETEEMRKVFNLGIGMILIVDRNSVDAITGILKASGESVTLIGEVIEK
ncbi:MAG: phosphoribosylformylglycinamidine cyclo-ligase [Candidatus Marinimicrobia bacterium]|nr:phosphoribosylformylglycinamidine cyclo-ligase [Candidatus Neomarinimicrobiota bacterium]